MEIEELAAAVNWGAIEKNIIKADNGCWVYAGYRSEKGYGAIKVRVGGRQHIAKVHRLMFFKKHGAIQHGHVVCHVCDNPSCVNPDHLFSGTQADNLRDMHRKGRRKYPEKKQRRTIEDRRNDERAARQLTYDLWSGGLSQKEVAERLGICRGQVSERLRRYRADDNIC